MVVEFHYTFLQVNIVAMSNSVDAVWWAMAAFLSSLGGAYRRLEYFAVSPIQFNLSNSFTPSPQFTIILKS